MTDTKQSKAQPIAKAETLRHRSAELEALNLKRGQAEATLHVSETRYRRLFETAQDGILILDADTGQITDVNPFLVKMLGYSHAEFVGRRLWEIGPFKDIAAAEAAFAELESKGYIRYEDLPLETHDGRRVNVEFVSNVYWVDQQRVIQCNIRDITARKRAEAEIQQLYQDLERRVAERTRELAAANARLTELDQLKSKFVSDVSHELRTPIANLKLYIDLLECGKPEKQAQYLAVLHAQVRRVVALVDDILDLSRLEQRKEQGVSYRAVALNELVNQVVLAHQPRAEADGLALTFEPAPDLPAVRGEANQLAQVISNLVTNALNYTSAGYVRVSTCWQDDRVGMSVEDSGSGILSEDLPHIFERFYRGHRVLKNDVPGTGLGLAIVKEIVDLHQGHIEVESQLGQGTTFQVWLTRGARAAGVAASGVSTGE